MRRVGMAAALVWLGSAFALAGAGAWTTGGPGGRWYHVVPDSALPGIVYTEIARSTDNGLSWQPNGLDTYWLVGVAAGPPGKVYVSGKTDDSAVVLASEDAGVHWSLVTSRPKPASPSDAFAWFECLFAEPQQNSQVLYAQFSVLSGSMSPSRRATFERSADGGRTWRVTGLPANGSDFVVVSLAMDPANPAVLLVAVNDFDTGIKDYRSVDAGASWQPVATAESSQDFEFDPHSPNTVYAVGPNGLKKSSDSGATFSQVASNLPTISRLLISPTTAGRFFALSIGSVFTSSDGASWTPLHNGLSNQYLNGLAIDPTGRFLHAPDVTGFVYDYQLDDKLVLNTAHPFTITLTATDQRTGRTGAGVATQVNDLWGYFSLPAITGNPNNPEVFVKMLDGTAINGMYWFFYGGLTDLEYTLTVKEDATGLTRTYTKPAGSECGGSDTAAFGP